MHNKNLCTDLNSSIFRNSQTVESTQMSSINEWINKTYIHNNGLLFNHEGTAATSMNLENSGESVRMVNSSDLYSEGEQRNDVVAEKRQGICE